MNVVFTWLPGYEKGPKLCPNVYRYDNPNGESRVIKTLPSSDLINTRISRMLKNLGSANHRNIVKFMEHKYIANTHYLVFEYLRGGSLEQLLAPHNPKPLLKDIQRWTAGLTSALAKLKTQNIIHRRVHPSNIYLTDEGRDVKLGYFLMSKKLRNVQMNTRFEDDKYTAPELLNSSEGKQSLLGHSVDVWSLGCVVHFMFTGNPPTNPPHFDPLIPLVAQDFITQCLAQDPRQRIEIFAALQHQFIRGISAVPICTPGDKFLKEEVQEIDAVHKRQEELIATFQEQVREAVEQVDIFAQLLDVYEAKTLADEYCIRFGLALQVLSEQFQSDHIQAQVIELQKKLEQKATDLLTRVRAS